MEVACGQCLGCRLDKSRMWAMRIVHESSLHELAGGSCFVTLTYRDPLECTDEQLKAGLHIPADYSLNKTHFTKFMKRLRRKYDDRTIRFFQCGEYGNTCRHGFSLDLNPCPLCPRGRPHHHAILFNYTPPDLEVYTQKNGEPRYTSQSLEKIWSYGFVDVGECNFESAAYVARYILKKVNGVQAETEYLSVSEDGELIYLEPEYCTMSRRPGIGRDFYEKYKHDFFPSDETPVPGKGVIKKVPRYYEKLFAESDPLTLEDIKALRQKFRDEHSDKYTPARLMSKYKVKKAQIQTLKRTVA